jgi:hypothetical protein
VHAGWDGQLFPSFVVSTATIRLPAEVVEQHKSEQVLGDPQGLLGVSLVAPEDGTAVTVTISCDAIMEPSTFTGTLATAGETYVVFPKIKWDYDALLAHHQPGPVTVSFEVAVGDDDATEETQTLTLRSINDCPFTIVDQGAARDISFVFAAYVNEDHPFVDKILREALNTGIVDSFTGYQSGDEGEVYRQAYALWHALAQRDVRYSSITTTSAEAGEVSSQHVRLIDESINNAQANCVDGSVLMASLLRKVGIEPMLVMVPGHCYLAFALDQEGTKIAALETTLIGSAPEAAAELGDLADVAQDEWKERTSWKSFTENAEKFKADNDPNYQLIVIAQARKLGILPIAFQSDAEFQSVQAAEENEDE